MAHNVQGLQSKNVKVARDFNNTTNVYSQAQAPAPVTSFRHVNAPIKSFQGRERLMEEVHEKLTECSEKEDLLDRMVALVGFGGMGKTELARKFVDVYKEAYPNVASINAESELSIKKSFEGLAEILKLPINTAEDGPKVAEQVYTHIGEHVASSLLIFDNANRLHTNTLNHPVQPDEPVETGSSFGILEYLPKVKYSNQPLFLITTRTAEWEADNIATVTVEELTKDESVRFLEARFELSRADPDKDDRERKNLASLIDDLYGCIQGYPLALQLAAANVTYRPKTDRPQLLHSRLKKFITKVKQLQDVMTERVNRGGTDYEGTFQIVWGITMKLIENDDYSIVGQHLLRILAYTDPDGAPCKEIQAVFEAHLPHERDTNEDEEFEEAMSLLKKLVLVHTYDDYKLELTTRMHRMVQSFTRRDDDEAEGLQCIMKGANIRLAKHFFTSQPKLAIPPAVLRSDQLIVAWLRCFIQLSIPIADNQAGPELLFDSTHEQQLRERNCTCVHEIRASVELIRNLQSAEWSLRSGTDALASGIIAYAKTIKVGSPLADELLELALGILNRRIVCNVKESTFLILKEWLLHPATVFPPAFYQEGTQLQLLVFYAITISEDKWEAGELKRLLYKDYKSMVLQSSIQVERFSEMYDAWNMEQAIEVTLRQPLERRFLVFSMVRSVLRDKKSTERLLAMKNIDLRLRRYLQALQAQLARKWEILSATAAVISDNRNPSSANHRTGREVIWDLMTEEFKDDVYTIASHIYMGYIICYSMALCDYDLNGGSFYQLLEKWLPSSEYLITISVLTKLPRKCNNVASLNLTVFRWNVDEDIPVMNSVLRKIREEKGPEPILLVLHQVVVEDLQLLSLGHKKYIGMLSALTS